MRIVLLIILISSLSAHGQNWGPAYSKLFSIDSSTNEVTYLHFKIRTKPEYHYLSKPYLTDVYYSIEYKEYGTAEVFNWVRLFDGHLINDLEKRYTNQWQGPFIGNRDISYKFLFELIDDPSTNKQHVNITIFSTNPELDFKYVNLDPTFPFLVTATYTDTSPVQNVIDIYSGVSTIYTVYQLLKGSNIVVTIGTAVLENLVIYGIQSYTSDELVHLGITCNVCSHKYSLEIEDPEYDNVFKCSTYGCHNAARIVFIK